MYFEEKMINGVLCWRNDPDGEFKPYGVQELSRSYVAVRQNYDELIIAVSHKYENESRHQTALRYIREAEVSDGQAAQNTTTVPETRQTQETVAQLSLEIL